MDIGKSIGLEYGAPTRNAFGEVLKELGAENPNIVVVDGDVGNSTRTQYFGKAFPDRFFNVGIAESNLIGVASGLAASGKDALASSFAIFLLGNAYDQIRMSIAFPRLNVKLVGSHSGISIGEDGPSQMGIEDIALAASLPGFTVLAPADAIATAALTRAMFEMAGPVYMRTGRSSAPLAYDEGAVFEIGTANRLRDGGDVTIVACGLMVAVALEAAAKLTDEGIGARVLDMHTIKPLDEEALAEAARETRAIVTVEEHVLDGGLGAAVARAVVQHHPVPMRFVGIDNTYAESGQPQELLRKYGLMPEHVVAAVREALHSRE
ncbi:MAG TPA: transketolase C-terminal domain-containing protein [Candidatus Sulfomarinibacteraceae bacterium]|nr:transketolase C-terminal domain-containing protein [Candidatus Sulfomarinibacteraceae bacterium]